MHVSHGELLTFIWCINDYRVFYYNGHAKYIIVDVDCHIEHQRNFYDWDWNNLHVTSDCPASDREIKKPENLDEMLRVQKSFPKTSRTSGWGATLWTERCASES